MVENCNNTVEKIYKSIFILIIKRLTKCLIEIYNYYPYNVVTKNLGEGGG